jgi:hypothetical protein
MSIPLSKRPRSTSLAHGQGVATLGGARSYFKSLNRPLAVGGCVLLFGALIAQLLPPVIRSSNVFNGLLTFSLGFFALIGFLFLRTKFRISFPAFILGLLQIWIVCTVFLAPQVFSVDLKLGRNIWWPTFILMPYLAAFVLVAIDPRWRDRVMNFILGVCLVTAVVALLQFANFPGTQQLSNMYTNLEGLKIYGLEKRSHGLSTHPFHLAVQCILGCGIVASNLLFRKLTVLEVFYYALLSGGLVVAQARTFYIAWGVVTIITLVMLCYRNKVQLLVILCLMGTIIVGFVGAFPEKLSYGLSNKNTINEGRMAQWMRADYLSSEYPITGIGPKETVFGSGTDQGGNRWFSMYTESGYRMSRVSGGFIELGLLILLITSSLYLAIKVAKDKTATEMRRRAAYTGMYFVIAVGIGLYFTNIVENELMTYYGMALAGIIAPQYHEIYKSYRGRTRLFKDRIAKASARLASGPG